MTAESEKNIPLPAGVSLRAPNPWRIVRSAGDIWLFTNRHEGTPVRVLHVNSEWKTGTVYLNRAVPRIETAFPLEPPLGELLFNHWAPWKDALILHAATLVQDGRAIVAIGHSGAGKSTVSRLWSERFGPNTVLTDERTLIRRESNGRWLAYGTPWQGSGAFSSPIGASLVHLVLLEKCPRNEWKTQSRTVATSNLLAHAFVPPVDRLTVEQSGEVAARMASDIPWTQFSFSIGPEAPEFLSRQVNERA
ncbi:MAG TPA: hypothetical protein VI895_04695 [Bdellovibrionota bacterium]|nr:hypothetical protein [Bdellovibrionota bacterium]